MIVSWQFSLNPVIQISFAFQGPMLVYNYSLTESLAPNINAWQLYILSKMIKFLTFHEMYPFSANRSIIYIPINNYNNKSYH